MKQVATFLLLLLGINAYALEFYVGMEYSHVIDKLETLQIGSIETKYDKEFGYYLIHEMEGIDEYIIFGSEREICIFSVLVPAHQRFVHDCVKALNNQTFQKDICTWMLPANDVSNPTDLDIITIFKAGLFVSAGHVSQKAIYDVFDIANDKLKYKTTFLDFPDPYRLNRNIDSLYAEFERKNTDGLFNIYLNVKGGVKTLNVEDKQNSDARLYYQTNSSGYKIKTFIEVANSVDSLSYFNFMIREKPNSDSYLLYRKDNVLWCKLSTKLNSVSLTCRVGFSYDVTDF